MLKAVGQKRIKPGDATGTRERIIASATETIKREGYSGTTARAIAARGDFNQALIFYHFGGVDEVLLAALDGISERQMARYSEAISRVRTLEQGMIVAARLFETERRDGSVMVINEMIAAANSKPELGPAILARMQPWIDFTEGEIRRLLKGSPLARLVPADDAAFALASLYLGMQMLTHLSGQTARSESVFGMGRRVARVLGTLVRATGGGKR